jgi:hypothetical protein
MQTGCRLDIHIAAAIPAASVHPMRLMKVAEQTADHALIAMRIEIVPRHGCHATDSFAPDRGVVCSQRDRALRRIAASLRSAADNAPDQLRKSVVGRRTVKPTFRVLPSVPTAPDATAAEPGGSAATGVSTKTA